MIVLLRVALAIALLAVVAASVAHWLRRHHPELDRLDRLAAAMVSPWLFLVPLWWARMLGSGAAGTLAAVVIFAVGLAATCWGEPLVPARDRSARGHSVLIVASLVFALLVGAAFLSWDLERVDGLHRMAMTDWSKHLTVTTTLVVSDAFPPDNPFMATHSGAGYYYGFHLVAAALAEIAHGPDAVFPALLSLTLLVAASVPIVSFVLARPVVGDDRTAVFAALAATFFAGFDLLVLAGEALRNWLAWDGVSGGLAWLREIVPSTHLDYWIHHNERQFSAPYLTAAWAPQHLAAALVAVMALHWMRGAEPGRARRAILPAVALASLPMLSAYVALGVGLALAIIVITEALGTQDRRGLRSTAAAWTWPAVFAMAASLPAVTGLLEGGSTGLVLHISKAGEIWNGAVATVLLGDSQWARLLDTPAVLLFDFGLVGLVALSSVVGFFTDVDDLSSVDRRHRRRMALMAVSILVLACLVRPPEGGPNNLYARSLLVVWFLAAAVGAPVGRRLLATRWRPLVVGGAAVCVAGTAYAAIGVVAEGMLFWAAPAADVAVVRWVNENTAETDLVAATPGQRPEQLSYRLRRRQLLADPRVAQLFGATGADVSALSARLETISRDAPTVAAERLSALGVRYWVRPRDAGAPPNGCLPQAFARGRWEVVVVEHGECSD